MAPRVRNGRGTYGRWIVVLAAFAVASLVPSGATVAAAAGRFTISGRVLNYAAAPLPGIHVEFCTAPRICLASSAGADGTFISPRLPIGQYRVRFTDPARIYAAGYATSGNTTDRWSNASVINLTSNRAGIVANMLPGTAIYGVVTGPTGAPLANASIASCGLPDQICGRDRSDWRGRYRATVGIGLFTVRVTAQVSGESFDGYIGQFGLTFSRDRAIQLLGQPGAAHGASVQITRAPTVSFVTGSQLNSAGDSAALSARIAWGATSDPATAYRLLERLDQGATHQIASVAAATFSGSLMEPLTVGHGYRFDVQSTRTAAAGGISGGVHRGPVFDLLLYQDSGPQVTYAGTWKRISRTDRSGGSAMTSVSMGATATFVFSGRAVGWISRTGPHSGTAQVYIDGQFGGTFDLSAPKVSVRTVVFSRSWPAAGTHTVEISESAIGSHPPVEIDAFVVMD